MALLDELNEIADGIRDAVGALARAGREWAASDEGQDMLAMADYCAVTSRVGGFYAHSGWYLPVHPALHRYALEHLELHQPFDPRDAVQRVGPRSPHWGWIVEGLLASPSTATRKEQVREALRCIEMALWHAAVSTLMPVIEGIASDRSGVLEGMRVGRRINRILHSDLGALEAISAVEALDVLDAEIFSRIEFGAVDPKEHLLNRHLVLHGRPTPFGSEANAVRTLMLLIALIEILDGAIVLRTSAAPPDGGSLLDDYGPLAPLRSAARGWRPAPDLRAADA